MRDTAPPSAAGLADWLRLLLTPGVGEDTAARLIARFASPAAVFAADFTALRNVVSDAVARLLCAPASAEIRARCERTFAWLALPGHHLLTINDARYPALLKHVAGPPQLLYVQGDPAWLSAPALAMVGSRNATVQGRLNAEVFAQALGTAGLSIVSGLALGIDAAAHRGALAGAGATVAVVGTGADQVYPAAHRKLAAQIVERGCIVSEYPLGTPPIAHNFPRRNRIISGLAEGVLVVEAAERSGSLITARLAGEQGRVVLAIPGSIHATLSKGCHILIKDGAKLVESAADVLTELSKATSLKMCVAAPPPVAPPVVGEEFPASGEEAGAPGQASALLDAIGYDPVDADSLGQRTGRAPGPLSAALLTLELAGQLERLPGGLFRRLKR